MLAASGVLNKGQTFRFTVLTGLVLGVLVTISSVGAGALGVTALILLYPELPGGSRSRAPISPMPCP